MPTQERRTSSRKGRRAIWQKRLWIGLLVVVFLQFVILLGLIGTSLNRAVAGMVISYEVACITPESWMPYSEREDWIRERIIDLGQDVQYSQEERDAEVAAKLRRKR